MLPNLISRVGSLRSKNEKLSEIAVNLKQSSQFKAITNLIVYRFVTGSSRLKYVLKAFASNDKNL